MLAIVEGFFNLAVKKIRDDGHQVEAKALRRLKICEKCDYRKMAEKAGEPSMKCPKCGCYLPAKARSSLSECPEGYWELKNGDDSKGSLRGNPH